MITLESKMNERFGEVNLKNKDIVSVDIQEAYEDYITFDLYEWTEFINRNYMYNNITFLYNGYDTLGMVKEMDYKMWLMEIGVNEEVIRMSDFYDKGYGYFRYCMDSDIDEDLIVKLVQFMYINDINDSRDITDNMWSRFANDNGVESYDIQDLLQYSEDILSIPELMEYKLKYKNNIALCGGGLNECLKEVELALKGLKKDYETIDEYTY